MTRLKNPLPPEGYLELGKLGKTFKLNGGIRFYPLGEAEAQAIFELKEVFVEGYGQLTLRSVKAHQDIILNFSQYLSLEAVKPLVNQTVYAPKDVLPEDGIYIDALIDIPVYLDGEPFGRVSEITPSAMQDILKIDTDTNQYLIPLQAPYVTPKENGIYLNNLPEGLLDLNS